MMSIGYLYSLQMYYYTFTVKTDVLWWHKECAVVAQLCYILSKIGQNIAQMCYHSTSFLTGLYILADIIMRYSYHGNNIIISYYRDQVLGNVSQIK